MTDDERVQDETAEHPAATFHIGPYEIIRLIGEGGMGRVYLARQTEPLDREVAVKVLNRGPNMDEIVARFHAERDSLARLSHPNIARVLDAGDTDEGLPYFVMEYVDGMPIDQVAADSSVSTSTIIDLAAQACDGIQHAHQKGLIHRDIKPANLLAFRVDGRLRLKVIDFGIARAVEGSLVDDALATRADQPVGTLAYMSPEQAGALEAPVDTRTDIYSLGVTLYQLISGRLPVNPSTAGLAAFISRLSDTSRSHPAPSAQTGESSRPAFRHHQRALSKDLDAIILKAIEKVPERRYASVGELGTDLRRYLNHEPVTARFPSNWYIARKFVERNTGAALGSGLALIALIAAVILSTSSLTQARRAQAEAQVQAQTATAISEFLLETVSAANPYRTAGEDLSLTDLLETATEGIESRFEDQPRIKARMLGVFAETYADLGNLSLAAELLERAIALLPDEADELELFLLQTRALVHIDNSEFDKALADIARAEALSPDEDSYLVEPDWRLKLMEKKAISLNSTGDYEQAAEVFAEAAAGYDALPAAYLENKAGLLNGQGIALYNLQRMDEAIAILQQSLALKREVMQPTDPRLATTLGNIGNIAFAVGDLEQALALNQESMEINRNAFGADHPNVADNLGNLAQIHEAMGDMEATRESYNQAVSIMETTHGADHMETIFWRFNRATFLIRQGQAEAGAVDARAARERFAADLGENHAYTLAAVATLAEAQEQTGDLAAALQSNKEALAIATAISPDAENDPNLVELQARIDRITKAMEAEGS